MEFRFVETLNIRFLKNWNDSNQFGKNYQLRINWSRCKSSRCRARKCLEHPVALKRRRFNWEEEQRYIFYWIDLFKRNLDAKRIFLQPPGDRPRPCLTSSFLYGTAKTREGRGNGAGMHVCKEHARYDAHLRGEEGKELMRDVNCQMNQSDSTARYNSFIERILRRSR